MHENGLLEKIRDRWWPDNAICSPYTTTRATAVTLVDAQAAFYLLCSGAALGLLALCLEHVFRSHLAVWAKLRGLLLRQSA